MSSTDYEKFQPARLIPVTGIKGALDQERRASSALLAVMRIVPELTQSLLKPSGAPKGVISAFIEPEFKLGGKKVRPDGLISIKRGNRDWVALVEVKTGKNELDLTQINQYLDICKEQKFDALMTISNQVLNASGGHPTEGIDLRKLRSTKLLHFSWIKIISESIVLSEHVGLDDPERQYILRELIRFLQSDASGASEFNDMGAFWTEIRDGIKTGAIRKPERGVFEVVSHFESLTRYAALTLSARLGVSAREVVDRVARADYKKHLLHAGNILIEKKTLLGAIDVPGAAARLNMEANLGSGYLRCGCDLAAPTEGKNRARINWLLRQLKASPPDTTVQWSYKHSRVPESAHRVVDLVDKNYEFDLSFNREIVSFRVEILRPMGLKRSAGKGGFIDSVVDLFALFYGEILQKLKPWQSPAPKLSETVREIIPEPVAEN